MYAFYDAGVHSVVAVVHDDGVEVDTVVWTITAFDSDAVETDHASPHPTDVTLYLAAPNPFNPTTTIRYSLPRSSDVQLTVYDSASRLVEALSDGWAEAGNHRAVLHGGELATGVYLLRLEAGSVVHSRKVVLLK